MAAPILSATVSGTDVLVSWPDAFNTRYDIWNSGEPYLNPEDAGSPTPATETRSPYTDGGAAVTVENHFYIALGSRWVQHTLRVLQPSGEVHLCLGTRRAVSDSDRGPDGAATER